jgi:hypothetical protein
MRKSLKKKLSLHKETLNNMDLAGIVGGLYRPLPSDVGECVPSGGSCAPTVFVSCAYTGCTPCTTA